jgi:diguanylate cyclase (GGDEF)-like protein
MDSIVANLNRVNSVLAMLSQVNRAIVRSDSPDGLYLEACRIAVECGLFKFAWIGLADSYTQQLRPMASWGEDNSFPEHVAAAGEIADLVQRSGESCICNNIQIVPHERPGRDDLTARGFRSMAGLPLLEGGRVVGVFSLYAGQTEFFDQTVLNLLIEVAEDISFALEHMLSEQRRLAAEAKLHYLAFYDAQTGLPNRTLFEERLPLMAALTRQRGGILTLLDIKLQRFDQVMQVLGHIGMDEVLRILAMRLENCRGNDGLVAQLAPDEFAMVTLEPPDDKAVEVFARHVQQALAQSVRVAGKEVFLHAGIGVVVYPTNESDIRYLLRRARVASDRAGNEGGFQLYNPEFDRDLEQRVEMEAELHRALERNEFELYYQPQLNLKTGLVIGVEALLRWHHPQRGLVSPAMFIPLLEECGLMPAVGAWVLHTACMRAKSWQDQGLTPLRMAVNLSAQQFRQTDLIETVKSALDRAGLEAEYLELELTESLILENVEQTIQIMHELKSLGVSLSLDDFGTGYSSLSYLRRYPIDRIKIDQSFVRDMTEHASSAALVRSILAMACNLGLKTIAEGVETAGQFGYLRKQLCQEMQGYLFSRPVPESDLTQLLREGSKFHANDGVSEAGYTLLVLDDEPNILSALRRTFRRENWQVLTATNATEGFELMATHQVGVIISDQRMPGISGTEFLHRVKEMYPDTIRILLTGYADFTTVIDAVNQGDLYKVLSKPMDDELLRETTREAFRRYEIFAENHRLARRLEELEGTQEKDDET